MTEVRLARTLVNQRRVSDGGRSSSTGLEEMLASQAADEGCEMLEGDSEPCRTDHAQQMRMLEVCGDGYKALMSCWLKLNEKIEAVLHLQVRGCVGSLVAGRYLCELY